MALSDDYILGTGNHWRIERGWETLTGNDNDPLPTTGINIPYYQETTNRRSYISTDGVGSSKAVKMMLTPIGDAKIGGGAEDQTTINQVWNSGFGLGDATLNGLDCVEGDEIWAKCDIFLSSNWSWGPASGSSLKLMRLYPSSYYEGELIAQVDQDGLIYAQTQGFTGGNLEMYTGGSGDASGPAFSYPIGQWFRLELYMKVSSDPSTARCRMWIDGVLRLDRDGNTSPHTGLQTLNRSGSTNLLGSPGLVLYSTWDAGATLTNDQQHIIYDNIVVTNDNVWVQANGEQDAASNWMIGDFTGGEAPPDLETLRTTVKGEVITAGYASLSAVLDTSLFKMPGGSTDSDKINNALVPLLVMNTIHGQNQALDFNHLNDGSMSSFDFSRYIQGQFNLVKSVYDRIHQLQTMSNLAETTEDLEDIQSNELNKGWPD